TPCRRRSALRPARGARCSARFAPHFKPSASCARTAAAARRAAKKKTPFSFEAVGCKKTSHNPSGRPYAASAPSPGRSLHRVALVDCLCAGIEICGACQTARGGVRWRLEETEDERAGLHEGVCERRRQVQPDPGGIARAAEKDELKCGWRSWVQK